MELIPETHKKQRELYYPSSSNKDTDFTGFTFNDKHSFNDLGIVRISDGSRYQENLLPTISNQTVQVPGGDGTYFFGSHYTQKVFALNFAFDSLTESKFRELKQWLNAKQMGKLTFDETPYKSYMVQLTDNSIQYICFNEPERDENNNITEKLIRVYKGEGTIQFTAYYPFGICEEKYLDLDSYSNLNKAEWSKASGLLPTQGDYDQINSTEINIYNPGDLPTDFKAYYQFTTNELALNRIYISESKDTLGQLELSGDIKRKNENDIYLRVDSETELLEGCDINKEPTGTLYNEYIISGDFFKIPIINDETRTVKFISDDAKCINLDYNYLYF